MIDSNPFKHRLQFLIHIIIWGVIIIFPLVFIYSEGERNLVRFLDFSLPALFLILVFYLNSFWIIPQYLFNKKIWQFFLVNIVLIAACIFLMDTIKHFYFGEYFAQFEKRNQFPPKPRMKGIIFFRDIISMSVTVGLSVAIKMTTQWYQSQAEQKELEKLHVESELNNLKHQLNPHFLFNTLNNIYSLISINQDHAQHAVHQLSNLIRYVLYDSDQPKVSLIKDLKFTSNFIELMSLRLPSHVKLETNISASEEDLEIAPLLFISLVENAFKHGVSPTEPSLIKIEITNSRQNEIVCIVRNSNFPKTESDRSGSGIGLVNLKKRLDLIYQGAYDLSNEINGEQYIATLSLKL
ncbi:MAG: histidine kinase [Bacteroidales bacterium]|nr:histidine kinase [Bacteroidales bacterium]